MSKPSSDDPGDDALREALERELLANIPLARAMQVRISTWSRVVLEIAAPLAPNINDKGCAFGGSLAGVMTLAGWALARLALDRAGLAGDIYVQDSTIRYLAPIRSDFVARAELDDEASFDSFLDGLRTRGKARANVRCTVAAADGTPATTLEARFVAFLRDDSSPHSPDRAQSVPTTGLRGRM